VRKDIKKNWNILILSMLIQKKEKKIKCCGFGLYHKRDLALNDDTFLEHV